jgi:hypothetical protein
MAQGLPAIIMIEVPDTEDLNVRSSSYLLAQAVVSCWRCKQPTSVFCLGLTAGHERRMEDQWASFETTSLLLYVEYLPSEIVLGLQELSPQYRPGNSTMSNGNYWINHCQHCGAPHEDYDLHCEPDGAFLPTTDQAAERILVVGIPECLSARVGGFSDELLFIASPRFVARFVA